MLRKNKILICDDSSLVRKKLKDILIEMNCEVFEAKNGKEVVAIFKEVSPDIVFMDIVMPEVDGLAALKDIKKYDEKAKVVMISSVGTSAKIVEALKNGACDFIQKPYNVEQISKVLSAS